MAAQKKKNPRKEDIPVVLPENFSADQILDPLKYRKDRHVNLKAGMYFFLDSLIKMSMSRRWRDYFDQHGGYPMYSIIMNKIIGNNYPEVITLLEKSGVIIQNSSYQAGTRTKLYSLTEKYSSVGYKTRTLSKAAGLHKRLLEFKTKQEKLNKEALSKIKFITKWFDPQRLSLDKKQAHSLIEFYLQEMKSLIPDPLPRGRSLVEIESRINHRVNSMIDTFKSVDQGHLGLKKTGKDNRLHSVVSNTKKELRGLYRFEKQPLISIDLRASQPYLLSQLLKPKTWGEKGLISTLFPELHSRISTDTYKKELDRILMFGTSGQTHDSKGFQKTGFFNFNWQTDFYQHLVDRDAAEGSGKIFPNRAAAKKKMMMILFDDESYMEMDKGFLLFKQWFPAEANIVSLMKRVSRETKASDQEDKGYNFLPILLQRLESYLILEKVCKKISKELPDAPIIPVHDCIMTTDKYHHDVSEITERVLTKITSLRPGLKIEKDQSTVTKQTIGQLATEDLHEIFQKKAEGNHIPRGVKPTILFEPPDLEGDWLVYSRFDPDGIPAQDEVIFRIIDDLDLSAS